MPEPPDLALLTAEKAAAILDVDVKTFRRMKVPFILAGKTRRYTRAILQDWLDRSITQWKAPPSRRGKAKAAPTPANNTSRGGRGPHSGKSPFESTVIAFERVVGPRTG